MIEQIRREIELQGGPLLRGVAHPLLSSLLEAMTAVSAMIQPLRPSPPPKISPSFSYVRFLQTWRSDDGFNTVFEGEEAFLVDDSDPDKWLIRLESTGQTLHVPPTYLFRINAQAKITARTG
jgi:hypothetical protein